MTKAEENLRDEQRQLDPDGIEVGVSRQAVDEVLAETKRLRKVELIFKDALAIIRGSAGSPMVTTSEGHSECVHRANVALGHVERIT